MLYFISVKVAILNSRVLRKTLELNQLTINQTTAVESADITLQTQSGTSTETFNKRSNLDQTIYMSTCECGTALKYLAGYVYPALLNTSSVGRSEGSRARRDRAGHSILGRGTLNFIFELETTSKKFRQFVKLISVC